MQKSIEKLLWLVDIAKLWTCIVDSKKQASKGLKKIVDDAWQLFVHKQSKINQNENDFYIFYFFNNFTSKFSIPSPPNCIPFFFTWIVGPL
jgi:hypothetical protein